jgi:hypothetical protein
VISKTEYRRLLAESRQVELLGYLLAAMGIGAAMLLLNAGDRSFWVFILAGAGLVAAGWAFMTRRRHGYRVSRSTVAGAAGIPYVDRHARPILETPSIYDDPGVPGQ